MNILSRFCFFSAIQGLSESEKDLIPLIKNQNPHNYCWAYSLTSAIELKYALQTGNRLKFNPYGIIDNVLSFWAEMKDEPQMSQLYENCKDFSNGGQEGKPKELYTHVCAAIYLMVDQKRMIYEYNNESSNVYLSNFSRIFINTLDDLLYVLKKNKMFLAAFEKEEQFPNKQAIITNYVNVNSTTLNHGILITGVGTIETIPGLFVEVVNSYGLTEYYPDEDKVYPVGYDGIFYIKVADSIDGPLINNRGLFSLNFIIDVADKPFDSDDDRVSKGYKKATIALGVLTAVFFILSVVFIILYCTKNRSQSAYQKQTTVLESL